MLALIVELPCELPVTTLAASALYFALLAAGGGGGWLGAGRMTTEVGGGSLNPLHRFAGLLGRRGSMANLLEDELSGARRDQGSMPCHPPSERVS